MRLNPDSTREPIPNVHRIRCECNSISCTLSMDMYLPVYLGISRKGFVVILDGCERGPKFTDRLIERRDGYSIYNPKEE